jgi:signal transduction histidine kinase
MALVTDSTPTSNPQFNAIGTRLLLSYLAVTTTILGISGICVYQVLSQRLQQQLDNHLESLAQTAARTLPVVRHEFEEHLEDAEDEYDDDEYDEYDEDEYDDDDEYQFWQERNGQSFLQENPNVIRSIGNRQVWGTVAQITLPNNLSELMDKYRQEGIFEVPSDYLRSHSQGVEWFDPQRRLMVREGDLFPTWEIAETIPETGVKQQHDKLRSYTIPVMGEYRDVPQLVGYVRASESTEMFDAELQRLRWGLGIGSVVALALTAIGGTWLTRESLKPVERSFDRLRQFTADASHELRSPLTAIKTSVSVMQHHPERIHPSDTQKIAAIVSAADQMSELVEDLLLLARMDDGGQEERRVISLDEVLDDAIEPLLWLAQDKRVIFDYTPPSEGELLVRANGGHLRRLFANLAENALQYTPEGGQVTVQVMRQQQDVLVRVCDTGIGIAAADIPHLFDRFWRADKARSHRHGGTGLGLSIAQTIAHGYGGQITVSSKLGQGSCFQVRLPLANTTRSSSATFRIL